jgi:hypothetical protein
MKKVHWIDVYKSSKASEKINKTGISGRSKSNLEYDKAIKKKLYHLNQIINLIIMVIRKEYK